MPSLWAATLLENLNDAHVAVNLCNRNYEGDISQSGDTVRITSIGRVTIDNYVKNSTSISPETLDDSQQVLTIDQAKYFAFQVDDVDARQVRDDGALMDVAMRDAAWGLGDAADTSVLSAMQSQGATGNALGALTIGTSNVDAYENIVDLAVKLDENNVPRQGRWCIIPPWYHGWLQKNANFVSYGTQANREDLENGIIGAAAGMRIVVSNNLPSASTGRNYVIAGHEMGITYAEQINSVEAYRQESAFSDAVKGLHLYGYKITRPYVLANADCISA